MASLSLGSSFRRLSLQKWRILTSIDLDDAVEYVEARRLPRQLHRTMSYVDASLFMIPTIAVASGSDPLPVDSLEMPAYPGDRADICLRRVDFRGWWGRC